MDTDPGLITSATVGRSPSGPPRRRWWPVEAVSLAAYMGVVFYGVAVHEPWADEVQSWLLARGLSPVGLFVHQLHYEGSPGLWQLLLMPVAHAGLPLVTLNLVGAVAAVSGVALLLFYSPLPLLLRVVLPFTYFLAYQYAVVSRSYNLLAPVLFGLAMAFRRRFDRPLRYSAVLCALSAVTVETMFVSVSMFAVFLGETWRNERSPARFWARMRGSTMLFVAVNLALSAAVWPTHDNASPLARAPLPGPRAALSDLGGLVGHAYVGLPWVSWLVLAVVSVWLFTRGVALHFLAPTSTALLFSALKLHQLFFDGLLTLLLVFGVWIGLDASPHPARSLRRLARLGTPAALFVLAVVAVVQVRWTGESLRWDAREAYSAGAAAGRFLARHDLAGEPVATLGDYWSVDLEPYLSEGRFSNVPGGKAYYLWSKAERPALAPVERRRAPLVAGTVWGLGPDRRDPAPPLPGYRLVGEFPGQIFWETSVIEHEDLVLYLRDDLALPPRRP